MKPSSRANNGSDYGRSPETCGLDRNTFISRVRASLERNQSRQELEPAPAVDPALFRLCRQDEDLPARFETQAKAVGMQVHRTNQREVARKLQSLLVERRCSRATLSIADETLAAAVRQAAADADCTVVDWRLAPGITAHYDVDVGITDVDAALAESGSIIISSGSARSRGTFLVPPMHIALVRTADILADMIDYFSRESGTDIFRDSTATTFITGPSKTADIEGILITGVHGPGQVHVLLLDQPQD